MKAASGHWFQESTLYQIYPRSFCDSSGNGVGDLRGITSKLDYLNGSKHSLGVTSIWLSPFYPSPMADFGYDIADFCDVDPLFGTLDDFKELLTAAQSRGIRVLIDLVPNHTSDVHKWFLDSKSSRESYYRDWYVWRDAKSDGSAPNNWLSAFGGSAWTHDEKTGQYYLHSFLDKQPDLNWDNPAVREVIKNVMRFWLDLGVDGFRVDAVYWLSKDTDFRDEDPNPDYVASIHQPNEILKIARSQNGPNLYHYLHEMAEVLASYSDKFMITEAYPEKIKKPNQYMEFYSRIDPAVCAPINFGALSAKWKAKSFRKFIDAYQSKLKEGYIPVYSTGNHDQPRIATRYGIERARTLAMLVLTLPGVPLIYYGDELGMFNVNIDPDQMKDPFGISDRDSGHGRDPERTPMQWNSSLNAGFSLGKPWLPVSLDFETCNAEVQAEDQFSMWTLYQKLITLRKDYCALRQGTYESFDIHPDVYSYCRRSKENSFTIVLNFSDDELEVPTERLLGKIRASTHPREKNRIVGETATLLPHEGLVIEGLIATINRDLF